MCRELQPLRFSARERRRGLPEPQVAKSNFIQHSELGNNLGYVDEKRQCLANRQLQYLVNILPVIADFQNPALEPRATALFADQLDIRQKLHLHGNRPVALTRFAASSRHVKGKMAGGVATAFRIRRIRENFPNGVERFEVRGGIRTRCSPDRRLIHNHHFPHIRIAFQPLAEFLDAPADARRSQRLVQHVVNQRGFARAAHPGHYRERSQRDHQIQILKIVQAGAVEADEPAPGLVPHVGHGNPQLPAEVPPRQ